LLNFVSICHENIVFFVTLPNKKMTSKNVCETKDNIKLVQGINELKLNEEKTDDVEDKSWKESEINTNIADTDQSTDHIEDPHYEIQSIHESQPTQAPISQRTDPRGEFHLSAVNSSRTLEKNNRHNVDAKPNPIQMSYYQGSCGGWNVSKVTKNWENGKGHKKKEKRIPNEMVKELYKEFSKDQEEFLTEHQPNCEALCFQIVNENTGETLIQAVVREENVNYFSFLNEVCQYKDCWFYENIVTEVMSNDVKSEDFLQNVEEVLRGMAANKENQRWKTLLQRFDHYKRKKWQDS